MTSGVFETWLKKLNRKMPFKKRKVLVFLDNASSYPTVEYSNVKLQFFPPNTTSMLQPMDQDITQATKWTFCKLQLQNMTTVKEKHKEKCVSEILKKIDLLQAITWIKKHGTQSHLKLFKNASNNVISKQKIKVKTVGLFLSMRRWY